MSGIGQGCVKTAWAHSCRGRLLHGTASGDKLPAAELPGCRLVLQCATRGDLSDYTFTHVTYARVAGAACGVAGSEVPTRGLSFCTGFSGALADALPQSSTIAGTSTNWQ